MGLIICFFYISVIYKKYYSQPMFPKISLLQQYSILTPIYPCDNGFWSLKWKVIRHAFVFLAFSSLIRYMHNDLLRNVLVAVNLIYTLLAVQMQVARSKQYHKETSIDILELIRPINRACFLVTIYIVLLHALLFFIFLMV